MSENKERIPLWIYPQIINETGTLFSENNCRSRSEFIEKQYIGNVSLVSEYEIARTVSMAREMLKNNAYRTYKKSLSFLLKR